MLHRNQEFYYTLSEFIYFIAIYNTLFFFYKNMTYKNTRLGMSKNKNIFKNID